MAYVTALINLQKLQRRYILHDNWDLFGSKLFEYKEFNFGSENAKTAAFPAILNWEVTIEEKLPLSNIGFTLWIVRPSKQ